DHASTGSASAGGGSGSAGGGSSASEGAAPASLPTRGLTREQYNNTIRDLLGDETHPADAFPVDTLVAGYAVGPAVVSPVPAHYATAAQELAEHAMADISTVLACDTAVKGEDPCAQEFIQAFGLRAYRRPLDPSEITDLPNLYGTAKATGF